PEFGLAARGGAAPEGRGAGGTSDPARPRAGHGHGLSAGTLPTIWGCRALTEPRDGDGRHFDFWKNVEQMALLRPVGWGRNPRPGAAGMVTRLGAVVGRLRGVLACQQAASLTDAALWERYVRTRDEAAFETLVRRHGPMVLGVCRRIL